MARIIQTADLVGEQDLSALGYSAKEWVYNGLDCCVTMEVLDKLKPLIDPVARETYDFSLALQGPILDMTIRGIRISQKRRMEVLSSFEGQSKVLDAHLRRLVVEGIGYTAAEATGRTLWWRSPQKVMNLFYDVMGLPATRKLNKQTGRRAPTANRDALEKLSRYFMAEPIVNHILALRDLDKKMQMLRTEVDSDGRIRANFNIAGTNTGRLASSMSDYGTGTNLQNIDRELRSVFIADPGMKFANLDLEQGDARNVGAICWNLFAEKVGEEYGGSYLNACESGDLHTSVCRMAWTEMPWTEDAAANRKIAEQIAYRQDSYRQLAKKLGHGTNYYGTPRTMAQHTKVDVGPIQQFQVRYFRAFPCIGDFDRDTRKPNYHNWVREQLQLPQPAITTPLGRRRFFFGRPQEDATLREAIAYSPQSMTADEIDRGLLDLWRANRVELLVQVHDSILFQYPEELEEEILPWAIKTLEQRIILAKGREFRVPVDAKVGWNWGDYDERNPDGLKKWKGGDDRSRIERPSERWSLKEMLG